MPEMGGLEVVRKLQHGMHMPVIVIVTAYDKYALQAFEAGAKRLGDVAARLQRQRKNAGTDDVLNAMIFIETPSNPMTWCSAEAM